MLIILDLLGALEELDRLEVLDFLSLLGFHKSAAKIQIIFEICKYLHKKNSNKKYIYYVYIVKGVFFPFWGIHPMVILWSSYGDPMVRECKSPVGGL